MDYRPFKDEMSFADIEKRIEENATKQEIHTAMALGAALILGVTVGMMVIWSAVQLGALAIGVGN